MLGIQVRFYVAFVVIGLHALLVGCTGVALDESVPFTIAAEGQPSGGRNNEPVTVAIRGDDPNRKVPYGLPDTAQTALKEILSKPDSALYVVVFDGSAGSTGFQVVIDAIVRRRSASGDSLIVRYHVSGPGPGQGGMTVMTYPFAIARIRDVNVEASAVVFEGPPHPTQAVQNVSFHVVAYGAPTDSGGTEPAAFAMRGDDANHTIPEQLPKEARDALQKVVANPDSALYLVIDAGAYPGTEYRVGIDFVEWHRSSQNDRLVVRYRVDQYGGGSASVRSHPFLILRVDSNVLPTDVMFEHR